MVPTKVSRPRTHGQFTTALAIGLTLPLGACATPTTDTGRAAGGRAPAGEAAAAAPEGGVASATSRVMVGAEVLLRDSLHLVRGRRVGLITNHTGIYPSGDDGAPASTIDMLHAAPGLDLVALYSPEHGLQGRAEAGEEVASGHDPATGLPIHSLYTSGRRPTPAMLEGVDVLVFDIQDIGTRYYTYVWTMALAMQAAGEAGLPFIVLDRPNPIGGHLVQGNVLDPAFATFVGLYPVPMRHGLTAGELARLLVGEHGIDVDLTVIPAVGWYRSEWFDETGLHWVAPSPNMPSLASATHYPGTCLFEGTNLSVGRGTASAFQHIGAPWLDAPGIVVRLEALALPGVRFEAVTFTPEAPGDGKFAGQRVRAIRFVATDRDRYDPTRAAIAALIEIRRTHPAELQWNVSHFDRLAGTDRVRNAVLAGASLEEVAGSWAAEVRAFEALRRPYLLYP
ncbi:MAG TPA: DUF1343 domain-containing protein [Longimicrobiales bacterium]|nr:DUF1343 domain-containing protein [Longimicrobiales bacterium]